MSIISEIIKDTVVDGAILAASEIGHAINNVRKNAGKTGKNNGPKSYIIQMDQDYCDRFTITEKPNTVKYYATANPETKKEYMGIELLETGGGRIGTVYRPGKYIIKNQIYSKYCIKVGSNELHLTCASSLKGKPISISESDWKIQEDSTASVYSFLEDGIVLARLVSGSGYEKPTYTLDVAHEKQSKLLILLALSIIELKCRNGNL